MSWSTRLAWVWKVRYFHREESERERSREGPSRLGTLRAIAAPKKAPVQCGPSRWDEYRVSAPSALGGTMKKEVTASHGREYECSVQTRAQKAPERARDWGEDEEEEANVLA